QQAPGRRARRGAKRRAAPAASRRRRVPEGEPAPRGGPWRIGRRGRSVAAAPPGRYAMDFDLLSAARDLIAADSVSAHGNLRAVEVLENVARTLGLETFRQEAVALGVPQANLIVHHRGVRPRDGGLLLVTHTDTVGPGPLDRWTKTNPLELQSGSASCRERLGMVSGA